MSSRKRKRSLIHLAAEMRRAKSHKRAESVLIASSVEDVSVAEYPLILPENTLGRAETILKHIEKDMQLAQKLKWH